MDPTQGATHFPENLFIKEYSGAKHHLFSQLWGGSPTIKIVITLWLHQI
jgi:hypothetical protein